MSVRAVIGKVVKHGRQILLGAGRKKATKPALKTEHESGKTPACLLIRNTGLQQQLNSQTGQSVIARNIQSCTYRSLAAELRRQAAVRLSGNLYGRALELSQLARSRLPIYAFITLGFAAHQNQDDEPNFDAITQSIKNIFEIKSPSTPEIPRPAETEQKLSSYELGPMIGIGCNAAVHLAKQKTDTSIMEETDTPIMEETDTPIMEETDTPIMEDEQLTDTDEQDEWVELDREDLDVISLQSQESDMEQEESDTSSIDEEHKDDYDLAIKMMFNYDIESNASSIWRGMEREVVPAQLQQGLEDMGTSQNGNHVKKKRLKPHPNIVEMRTAFVDDMPALPEGISEYPLALPPRIQEDGCGRNKTLFAVMKRYDRTLKDYLKGRNLDWLESTCLLTQLVEAVAHLSQEGLAHRDLKCNNIFLDLRNDQVPQLVLGDFGCCFDGSDNGLKIRYETDLIDRGGNPCLMAPEISTAYPGPHSFLDYNKADLWAVGAIAYEIFGGRNPFYGDNDNSLNSRMYNEEDLPQFREDVPSVIQAIIRLMLIRDPAKRPTASQVADMLHFVMWSPREWLSQSGRPPKVNLMHWLLVLTTEVMMEKSFRGPQRSTCFLKETFLSRLEFDQLLSSIELLYTQV